MKANNFLVEQNGTVILGDFGLSKLPDTETLPSLKGFGAPSHVAPELFEGAPKSRATDIYGFGITIAQVRFSVGLLGSFLKIKL